MDEEEERQNIQIQFFEQEYDKLTNRFEAQLLMHKLAAEYYKFRAFWFNFIPLTLISSYTTIQSVFIYGVDSEPSGSEGGGTKVDSENGLFGMPETDWLSLSTAILAAIATFITTMGKYRAYQSHADKHENAVKAIRCIVLEINFAKDWFDHYRHSHIVNNNTNNDTSKSNNDNDDGHSHIDINDASDLIKLGSDLKEIQTTYEAVKDACQSPFPDCVLQAFTVLDHIVDNGECQTPELVFYYHKLWKSIEDGYLWPLLQPQFGFDVPVQYQKWKKQYDTISILDQEPSGEDGEVPRQRTQFSIREYYLFNNSLNRRSDGNSSGSGNGNGNGRDSRYSSSSGYSMNISGGNLGMLSSVKEEQTSEEDVPVLYELKMGQDGEMEVQNKNYINSNNKNNNSNSNSNNNNKNVTEEETGYEPVVVTKYAKINRNEEDDTSI